MELVACGTMTIQPCSQEIDDCILQHDVCKGQLTLIHKRLAVGLWVEDGMAHRKHMLSRPRGAGLQRQRLRFCRWFSSQQHCQIQASSEGVDDPCTAPCGVAGLRSSTVIAHLQNISCVIVCQAASQPLDEQTADYGMYKHGMMRAL